MGSPKHLLQVGGRSFLDRVVSVAKEAFDEVVAVDRPGDVREFGIRTIVEMPHERAAPVFGVQRALQDAKSGKAWILAIDYPLMTGALLRDLRLRFEASPCRALIPRWSGRMQMLCAGYSPDMLPEIGERLQAGRLDLRGLASADCTLIVDEDELRRTYPGEPLMNVNTVEELDMARRIDAEAE
jgi:molybdopterin-guanine dinucleotide biosynthesis protein A